MNLISLILSGISWGGNVAPNGPAHRLTKGTSVSFQKVCDQPFTNRAQTMNITRLPTVDFVLAKYLSTVHASRNINPSKTCLA